MRTAITIPVYNERENLERLLPHLERVCPEADIIIVDDNSPDGSADYVESFSQKNPRVRLIRRPGKLGYASAIKAGHQRAMDLGAEVLCQMDADFSHDPEALPSLLREIKEYDVVTGSRYVPGGGTRNWGIFRQILSRGGNAFARRLLRLSPRDCTGGYRCFRREALERAGILDIQAEGYCFQIVTMYRCQKAGLTICEVPILFVDRRFGKSKLSRRIIVEAFFVVLRLWLRGH